MRAHCLLSLFVLLAAPVAQAGDGVVLLNQARGDALGWPIQITQSGAYKLASNLVVPDQNTHAIQITNVASATLDLAGFAILGPADCSGNAKVGTLICTNTGTGDGILASGVSSLVVRNGHIAGIGDDAIQFSGNELTVEDLNLESNGGDGVFMLSGRVSVDATRVVDHGGNGLRLGTQATVRRSVVVNQVGSGISATSLRLEDSVVARSFGTGVLLGAGGSAIVGNVICDNNSSGLRGLDMVVRFNSICRNGGAGIFLDGPAIITGNSITANTGDGVDGTVATTADGVGNNVLSDNDITNGQMQDVTESETNLCDEDITLCQGVI